MAEQSEIEELQLALESEICGLTNEELIKVAQHVNVSTEGLRKLQISKRIREKIEADIEKSQDKKGLLQELSKVVGVEPPALENPESDTLSQSQGEETQKQSNENQPEPKSMVTEPKSMVTEPKAMVTEPKVSVDIAKAFKRDFKIFGTVGGDSHKDGLSFVSLVRQIDTGIKSGYKEAEVIEAVIRAVNPSLKLRSYPFKTDS
jgi:hypothetical protein